jgi:ParB/Sulfiredoxin domain
MTPKPKPDESSSSHPKSQLTYISPDELEFDPNNPRFGGLLSKSTQGELQSAIFGEPYYASELVDSLLENGFIDYEPLIVRRDGNRLIVVEGNRRLAAVRHIRSNISKYPNAKSNLDKVPVLLFPGTPDDVQENAMRVYLGVRHLLGFREWPPVSKAIFLDRESRSLGSLDQIIKEVRITKQQARRFLVPYRLLKKAELPLPPGEDFWVLGEALGRTGVKGFLQLDVDPNTLEVRSFHRKNLSILMDDLYGQKVPGTKRRDPATRKVKDTRDMSLFAKILSSDKARAYLHKGKRLQEASIYVDTREESLARLTKITKEMSLLVRKLLAKNAKNAKAIALHEAFKRFEGTARLFLKEHAKSI